MSLCLFSTIQLRPSHISPEESIYPCLSVFIFFGIIKLWQIGNLKEEESVYTLLIFPHQNYIYLRSTFESIPPQSPGERHTKHEIHFCSSNFFIKFKMTKPLKTAEKLKDKNNYSNMLYQYVITFFFFFFHIQYIVAQVFFMPLTTESKIYLQ